MNAFALNALDSCADKMVLPKVEGTLKRVFQRRTGENDNGPWSVQDFELEGDGVVVKVKAWNKDEIARADEGKHVEIMASDSKGLTGVFVHDDTYNGKTTRMLRLTKSAILQIGSRPSGSQGSEAPAPESTPQSDAPRNDNRTQQAPPQESRPAQRRESRPENPITEAKKELMKLANLRLLATEAVHKYVAPETKKITGSEMAEDRKEAAISSLIIAGERRGIHLKLPTGPLNG